MLLSGGLNMFQIGDYIICGSNGVCEVCKIGSDGVPGAVAGRTYYTLSSVYSKGKTIFTPVDNEKVVMRPILTRAEAEKLVSEIKDIEMLWISDEKRREESFKAALRTCDCRELVKIIKTLYLRRQERLAAGKKSITNDEKYLKLAENSLYEELAIPLELHKEDVEKYIKAVVAGA